MSTYNSPYQPQMNSQEAKRIGANMARSALERGIIYGYQGIKFVIQFIIDALHQVTGH